MVQAFQGYRDFLRDTPGYDSTQLQQQELELERFGLSHYQIGARMAEHWYLPTPIVESIRLQPELTEVLADRVEAQERSRTLLAILTLAQDISAEYRYYWRIRHNDTSPRIQAALSFLAVPEYDYLSLKESLIESMA